MAITPNKELGEKSQINPEEALIDKGTTEKFSLEEQRERKTYLPNNTKIISKETKFLRQIQINLKTTIDN